METYFAGLVVLTCLMALILVVFLSRYRKDIERRKATEALLRGREQEHRTLLASAERQTRELKLLDQVRTALARELDLSVMLRTVVEAIVDTFGYTQVSLYLLKNGVLELQHQVGYDTVIRHIPVDKGVSGRTVRTGEPVLLKDVRTDPEFLGAIEGVVSEVCIPLFDQGRVAGTLNVESTQGVVLDEADLMLMTALSDHVNIALARARLYAQVRESEAKYRSVVDNINEVIFQTNEEWRFTFLNPAWSALTGYDVQESLGSSLFLYVHPDDRRPHREFFQPLIDRQQESVRGEFRYVTRDGSIRWFEIHTRRTGETERTTNGIFGTITDTTDRKRIDEERLRLSKLEAISPLAGGIAHDFNNLLTGILGHISFAQLLVQPDADDLLKARLEMAEKAAMEAQKLTQQLLTFARGGMPVKQIASIRDLIYETIMFISRGSNVRCDFDIPDDLWPAEVDAGQIGQVLQNLILNAQQAMPAGGVIRIGAANATLRRKDPALQLPPGSYVTIKVTDEGIGIPPEILPKIFDPYFTTKPEGSGLGLATAHSIITNHRGAITVESVVGRGTTFILYILATPASFIPRQEEERAYYHGAGRILVMEDEHIVRNLVGDILEHCGYSATLTRDGAAAVEEYVRAFEAGEPYGAVIMDLTVPGGMGGRDATAHILQIDPKARIIACSGYSNDPVMADYRKYGFVGMVPKPYRSTQLSKVLHDVLSDRHAETV
jgi:PAS domain S-box-containing protein